jgi:hypothetical protein
MKPRFADIQTWEQAELLMQPAFIRVVDNLRKQLETSNWTGTYRDVMIWADDIPESVKQTVTQLQTQLQTASAEQAAEIEAALSQLPSPYPGYELCLQQSDRQINIDIWQVCYKICFQFDDSDLSDDRPVEIDLSLIDEHGEVDWNALEQKTKRIVAQIFASLPSAASTS